MAERLLIKNFAGLDIDIELGRINLFIGPQASGKSVCAKCLYLFRSFVPGLLDSAIQAQDRQTYEKYFLNRFREYFPNLFFPGAKFLLQYHNGEAFIEITAPAKTENIVANLTYSPFIQEAATEIRQTIRRMRETRKDKALSNSVSKSNPWDEPWYQEYLATKSLRNDVESRADIKQGRQAFVIAGRAFLSTLKGSILTVLGRNPVADPLLQEFLQLYETARRYASAYNPTLSKSLKDLVTAIVRGQLLIEGEEEFIELVDERRIPLANASSGQQEAFSLLAILLMQVGNFPFTYSTLYAEEPEAHLFPESQRALARLMALVYNTADVPVQYVITTHSPYLLSVFNNLVYAYQVQEAVKDDAKALRRLSRIVPKAERLALADFRAYSLDDGKAQPIINYELGLLSADLLDGASEKINEQFDKLTSLDPSTKPNANQYA